MIYYNDVYSRLQKLLSCANPEACFSVGAWPHHRKYIPNDLVLLIAEDRGLPFSGTTVNFIVYFDENMVNACRNDIAERVLLGYEDIS